MERSELHPDPLQQFLLWYEEATHSEAKDPDAAALATATSSGAPSVRYVLYKGIDSENVVFYTNYDSRKAKELSENPRAAMAFYWPNAYRQVRVEGTVAQILGDLRDEKDD